jgi:hypothetical protein
MRRVHDTLLSSSNPHPLAHVAHRRSLCDELEPGARGFNPHGRELRRVLTGHGANLGWSSDNEEGISKLAVNKKLRFKVLLRDNLTCRYCGRKPPDVALEIDHVTPITKGGADCAANLLTACFDCNRGKGAHELESRLINFPQAEDWKTDDNEIDARWTRAMVLCYATAKEISPEDSDHKITSIINRRLLKWNVVSGSYEIDLARMQAHDAAIDELERLQ